MKKKPDSDVSSDRLRSDRLGILAMFRASAKAASTDVESYGEVSDARMEAFESP